MWWSRDQGIRRFIRLGVVLAVAGLLAGCFEPLYGDRSIGGGPGIRDKLSSVDVLPIEVPQGRPESRIGVEIRNALLFGLTGGSGATSPTHQLKLNLQSTRQSIIVDIHTTRPDVENYGLDVTYTL